MMYLAIYTISLGERMNKEEIAWLAGIYEGEGSCSITTGRAIRIDITMTDEDIVNRIQLVTGLGSVRTVAQRSENHKQAWCWSVGSKDAVNFLEAVLPWLGERRSRRARDAVTNWKTNRKQSTHLDTMCVKGHYYDRPDNRRTKYGTCHLCNLEASKRYREKTRQSK
jgi:hypothetical protein